MKVILLGASNPETIRIINAVARANPSYDVLGFIDNDSTKEGELFYGKKIFGGIDKVRHLIGKEVFFVNLITGSTKTRYETTKQIVEEGCLLTNLIYPSVDLFMTKWGVGNYIQEGVIVQANVEVGDNNSIHMGSLIGHETIIGNSVFIAHAVSVSGCCQIGDGTFIGTNATILPRVRIGKWVTIGAGAVINKDVPDYAIITGNPGRILKWNEKVYLDGKVLNRSS